MQKRFFIYGIGNAIMDLQLQVEESDIVSLGLVKSGMQLVDAAGQEKLLAYFKEKQLSRSSGGSAANTVIALAQLGISTAYGCLVGNDEFGAFYQAEMKDLGVLLHNAPIYNKPTGTCVVLITPDAERTMNTHLGANVQFSAEYVSEELIAQSDWLYIEGYLFSSEFGQQAARQAIRYAKIHGAKIAVTFSDAFIVKEFKTILSEVVKEADLIFANLREAQEFVGLTKEEDVYSSLKECARNAIVTLHDRGAWIYYNNDEVRADAFKVKAIDETGAGDMFAGGFMFGLAKQLSLAESARFACYAASQVVSQIGARLSGNVRSLLDVDQVVKRTLS